MTGRARASLQRLAHNAGPIAVLGVFLAQPAPVPTFAGMVAVTPAPAVAPIPMPTSPPTPRTTPTPWPPPAPTLTPFLQVQCPVVCPH